MYLTNLDLLLHELGETAPMIQINMSRCVCILVRHSIVVLLLMPVLQRAQDWYIFTHHPFILNIYLLHWIMSGSTSESLKTGKRTLSLVCGCAEP